ncbi:unnamed protein product [Rhizophagus irregularis]|nr:unnamed protein product [Rhizophagus irregularis]
MVNISDDFCPENFVSALVPSINYSGTFFNSLWLKPVLKNYIKCFMFFKKYLKEIVLVGVQCPLIGEAIGTQYPSLTYIRLEEYIYIPLTILSKLINLNATKILKIV